MNLLTAEENNNFRTLGIRFDEAQDPACAEIFLQLSPRVQYRGPNFVFCDIADVQKVHGGATLLLEQALQTAEKWGGARVILATQPYWAEALLTLPSPELIPQKPGISPQKILANKETQGLLPLNGLLDLQGLCLLIPAIPATDSGA